jgi:hypothetical protein
MVMNSPARAGLMHVAAECVALVGAEYSVRLDWSLDSLAELDDVCATLLAEGPLSGERLDLWWKLIGAYTGEVLIRTYGGEWITHDEAPGAYAVSVRGLTAFPFGVAHRVLRGEPYKSLATLARGLAAVAEDSRNLPGTASGVVEEEPELPRLPVDPARQPAIDDLIRAGRYGDAIAAARAAYALTMHQAFFGVMARKRELGA